METALPTVQAISEIESRQDEVLRKLDELEKQILRTLAEYGDKAKSAVVTPTLSISEPVVPSIVAAQCEGSCNAAGGGKCRRKAA